MQQNGDLAAVDVCTGSFRRACHYHIGQTGSPIAQLKAAIFRRFVLQSPRIAGLSKRPDPETHGRGASPVSASR
jgi:hypothetical protein